MIEFAEEEEAPRGSPAWMATFADLMSLLMCFFVLLLSFSEMDVQKYKLVAGSMKNAFGIQQEVVAIKSPSGSAELSEDNFAQSSAFEAGEEATALDLAEEERLDTIEQIEELMAETTFDVEKLKEAMNEEIQAGLIELESGFRLITIRIKEKGSFDSGSANLQTEFIPVMAKLQSVLIDIDGQISVEGHTDNVDISTARFASNWALSASRALSVGHELLRNELIESSRFVISGYSDTVPFTDNETVEGRASNRRVEIIIRQPFSTELGAMAEFDPTLGVLLEGVPIDSVAL